MKSPVVKRSIVVGGHKTSVSLEEAFWNSMKEISAERAVTLSELVGEIDTNRHQGNLSSAIRLFVLDHFKTLAVGPTGGTRPRASHAQGLEESSLEKKVVRMANAQGSAADRPPLFSPADGTTKSS
jgi:predicted DNA-binding ribbon-helix-helix protein